MGQVISFTAEKIARICTAENNVREKLRRVLEHMNISDAERAVAMNTAIYRVRHGGHPETARKEAIRYARGRENARAMVKMAHWPDGVA